MSECGNINPMAEQSIEDREANYFAMCLLMPEDFLREDVRKIKLDGKHGLEEAIEFLAKKYKVSEVHMTIRIGQLEILGKP